MFGISSVPGLVLYSRDCGRYFVYYYNGMEDTIRGDWY